MIGRFLRKRFLWNLPSIEVKLSEELIKIIYNLAREGLFVGFNHPIPINSYYV